MERRVLDRMTGLFALTAVCTAAGSVLAALYPDWHLWQGLLYRQGMGLLPDGRLLTGVLMIPLVYLAVLFLLGLSAWGEAGVLLLLLRGTVLGGVLTLLYRTGGAAGVLTAVLFVVPYACAAALVQSYATLTAGQSTRCVRRRLAGEGEPPVLRAYALRFAVCAGLLAVLGLVQCAWLHLAYPAFLDVMTQ
ncbi:MAG: hypothetical protein IJ055_06025 [Oscillospiraceae bacterium]|nr:hypothetical protein [Oscillospiraceae bacterium]